MLILGAVISLKLGDPAMADAEAVCRRVIQTHSKLMILPLLYGGQALYMSTHLSYQSADKN